MYLSGEKPTQETASKGGGQSTGNNSSQGNVSQGACSNNINGNGNTATTNCGTKSRSDLFGSEQKPIKDKIKNLACSLNFTTNGGGEPSDFAFTISRVLADSGCQVGTITPIFNLPSWTPEGVGIKVSPDGMNNEVVLAIESAFKKNKIIYKKIPDESLRPTEIDMFIGVAPAAK